MAKFKYFKLGEKATTFVDPKLGINLVGTKQVLKLNARLVNTTNKNFMRAKSGGHIVEVSEEDYKSAGAEYQSEGITLKKEVTEPPAEDKDKAK